MKPHTLPVKRRPVTKGILRRLSAVTGNRKQRVAAAAAPGIEMESEESGSKISRALTIIFLIHIVAIGLIFVHQRFLDGRPSEASAVITKEATAKELPAAIMEPRKADLPRLSSGEKPYIVKPGDNYTRIAAAAEVDEGDLRLINQHVDIGPGLILKIPPKRIVAEEPPEVAAIRAQTSSLHDQDLVDAVDVSNAPKAQLVRPNPTRSASVGASEHSAAPLTSSAVTSGKSYVVQSGDSVFRIASRFKVNQTALMRANSISDPKKMKVGMKLVIPQT
jgi:LysM repeat protein